ncbi:hypothetical protein EMCG_03319 [[Emmonsia] crescens]|uniref:F-box domain-containing protein n=1 Tax=[Emmonsia] crescens TaxID=73230 RepID=A0A0G2J8G3_9EURO|nr:hypothetical protein EMCG_03319 [Emmonsia crescens UAMH 3008]
MGLLEYEGAFVFGTGLPSGVFRFAGHTVLGVYMSSASTTYNYVKNHAAIVQQPPFHPNTLYLSHLASKWSTIGFWWNFAMWIPTLAAPSLVVTIIGLFDVTLMVYFGIITVHQGAYIPHSTGPCRTADTWQVPMNGNGSYFRILETLNTYPDKPETHILSDKICKDFVSQWRLGVGSLVIYILVSFSNVIIGLIVSIRGIRSQMPPEGRRKEPYIFTALKVVLLIPYCIYYGLIILSRLSIYALPYSIQSRIRFGLRYINKASQVVYVPIQELLQKTPISLTCFKRRRSPPEHKEVQVETKSESAPLARFLHIDVLTLVAQHLHYQDLLNLSLASKEMRRTLFPDGHFGNGARILRIYACDRDTKAGCFSCGEIRRFTRQQLDIYHEETCKPFCSPCYYNKISTPPENYGNHCNRKATLPAYAHGIRGHFGISTVENGRLLCGLCNSLSSNECLAQRYEQEQIKMKRKLKHKEYRDDFTCNNCSKALPSWGPRWWVCLGCKGECTDPLHPPWGFKPSQQQDIAGITGFALLEV